MKISEPVKSNLKLHSVTVDEVNPNFKFQKDQAGKNHCDLVKKMINAYFGTIITPEKTKEDKYIRVSENGKQVLKLNTNKDFLKLVKSLLDKLDPNLIVKTSTGMLDDLDRMDWN